MAVHRCIALFIIPSLQRGGAETQAIELVDGLDPARVEKHVVVLDREIDQIARIGQSGAAFHHYKRSSRFDLSVVRRIARLIDQQDIGVVHCTLQIALFYGWLAIRLAKSRPRLLAAIHTTVNVSYREELFDRLLYRYLLRSCERVIFVCRTQAAHWEKKYGECKGKSAVIYNGVDPDYFNPETFKGQGIELRRRLSIPYGARVIACIAGFRREKGHHHLIQAFSALDGKAHLILAGDGIVRKDIEHMVNSMGLSERVHFLGTVSDVRPVLAATDLSVLASTAVETFSMAMLESMAMEVPVVATAIGGLAEAIENGETGYIVEVGDVRSLTEAMRVGAEVVGRAREMGKKARRRVQEEFTRKLMVDKTESELCGDWRLINPDSTVL